MKGQPDKLIRSFQKYYVHTSCNHPYYFIYSSKQRWGRVKSKLQRLAHVGILRNLIRFQDFYHKMVQDKVFRKVSSLNLTSCNEMQFSNKVTL